MTLTGAAKVAGVIGWPIAHSLSPLMHAHWIVEYGVDAAYVPLAVPREDFATVLKGLQKSGFKGVNVTVPHKEAAYAIAHRRDAAADAAGAANLLLFEADGRIAACNTDSEGLRAHIADTLGEDALDKMIAVVAGAGGAARATILALDALGVAEIRIVNRNRSRADALRDFLGPKTRAKLSGYATEDWTAAAADAGILVNSTSTGMKGQPRFSLPLDPLPRSAFVCDLVYNPLETELLKQARAGGHNTVDGLGMLMHQGAPAFAAFFGVTPTVSAALRARLEKALNGVG